MSFNKKPLQKVDKKETISDFINEPVNGTNTYKNNDLPWLEYDKNSKTRRLFNVRFNEYYESAYKYFSAKHEFDSYQNFVRGIIETELDKLIDQENK